MNCSKAIDTKDYDRIKKLFHDKKIEHEKHLKF